MNASAQLASRRVLLTGGLGSLGQAQMRKLRAAGADVYILDLLLLAATSSPRH